MGALHGAAPLRRRRRHLPQLGGRISYLECDAPEDAPVLVFLHANGFHAGVYRRLLEPLAGTARILAPDLRGHGRTELPVDPAALTSWTTYRDDLLAFLDAMEIERPWVAGHSLGGVTAALLSVHAPERVQGMVLIDPVFLPRWIINVVRLLDPFDLGWRLGPGPAALRRRDGWPDSAAARAHYHGRGMFGAWPEGWLDDYLADGLVEREGGSVGLACKPTWESRTFASVPRDVWTMIRGIRCPTTIVYGEESDTFRPASARLAPRRIPGARMVPVPGASHFVPMERPDIVQEEIRRTLSLP
jgi:pimeloyl-ACP methyl ester carboxylesterase